MLHELPRANAAPERPQITATEAAAMARTVVNLFARWDLSDAEAREILGGLAARTYARWKAGEVGRIDRDLATRLSLLMGIHKACAISLLIRRAAMPGSKSPTQRSRAAPPSISWRKAPFSLWPASAVISMPSGVAGECSGCPG